MTAWCQLSPATLLGFLLARASSGSYRQCGSEGTKQENDGVFAAEWQDAETLFRWLLVGREVFAETESQLANIMTTSKSIKARLPTLREVAVVIPCYNVEVCLERSLGSVLAQTYRDFCFYAVDDGSTDSTPQVLERYANRGVCAFQVHAGQAAARNRGIRLSGSPFVAFLDADDEWLPTKLERQIAWMKQNPSVGMICSGCAPGEGNIIGGYSVGPTNLPKSGRLFEQLLRDCNVFTPTVVVRRQCLEEVGLFDESLGVCEDFNLWLRIAAHWNIAILPEVLAIRHVRPKSLSLGTSVEVRLRSAIAALENVGSVCLGLSLREKRALRRAIAERIYLYGSYLLSTGAKTASRRKLLSALRFRLSHSRAFVKLGLSYLPTRVSSSFVEMIQKLRIPLRSGRP